MIYKVFFHAIYPSSPWPFPLPSSFSFYRFLARSIIASSRHIFVVSSPGSVVTLLPSYCSTNPFICYPIPQRTHLPSSFSCFLTTSPHHCRLFWVFLDTYTAKTVPLIGSFFNFVQSSLPSSSAASTFPCVLFVGHVSVTVVSTCL